MAEDHPLARYRRRQAYQAFKASGQERYRLKVRPVQRSWERMLYSHLWRIMEDGGSTQIGLIFSFAVVRVHGRNLAEVVEAIDRHCCEFLEEFDREKWDEPTDPKAPFIEKIDIFSETREQKVKATDQMLADMAKSPR